MQPPPRMLVVIVIHQCLTALAWNLQWNGGAFWRNAGGAQKEARAARSARTLKECFTDRIAHYVSLMCNDISTNIEIDDVARQG
eukprot:scaffold10855_cov44-Tisochrysis_lutea.AAC.1